MKGKPLRGRRGKSRGFEQALVNARARGRRVRRSGLAAAEDDGQKIRLEQLVSSKSGKLIRDYVPEFCWELGGFTLEEAGLWAFVSRMRAHRDKTITWVLRSRRKLSKRQAHFYLRSLAADLKFNPQTLLNTFRRWESRGLIRLEASQNHGCILTFSEPWEIPDIQHMIVSRPGHALYEVTMRYLKGTSTGLDSKLDSRGHDIGHENDENNPRNRLLLSFATRSRWTEVWTSELPVKNTTAFRSSELAQLAYIGNEALTKMLRARESTPSLHNISNPTQFIKISIPSGIPKIGGMNSAARFRALFKPLRYIGGYIDEVARTRGDQPHLDEIIRLRELRERQGFDSHQIAAAIEYVRKNGGPKEGELIGEYLLHSMGAVLFAIQRSALEQLTALNQKLRAQELRQMARGNSELSIRMQAFYAGIPRELRPQIIAKLRQEHPEAFEPGGVPVLVGSATEELIAIDLWSAQIGSPNDELPAGRGEGAVNE